MNTRAIYLVILISAVLTSCGTIVGDGGRYSEKRFAEFIGHGEPVYRVDGCRLSEEYGVTVYYGRGACSYWLSLLETYSDRQVRGAFIAEAEKRNKQFDQMDHTAGLQRRAGGHQERSGVEHRQYLPQQRPVPSRSTAEVATHVPASEQGFLCKSLGVAC